ncbi:hypothetical protein TSAR_003913 [Trichomalopsis sarcophagae]|uniref:Uncharacterized protein n=1 Tax=Trichomalopsis sarcophagae TaxID=543379 RepID=A0A232EF58_9HYME|nr:hypothetical protein TSAR_003913 [Trichomalopsis sarcophagae]
MLWSQVTFFPWTLQVLAFAALCTAESAAEDDQDKRLLPISANPVIAGWTVFGVITATTLSVIMLLVPTLLYYKYWAKRDDPPLNECKN